MIFKIEETHDNTTVKSFLESYLKLSHKDISRLKNADRGIILNGERVTVRKTLNAGDILEIDDKDPAPSENIEENDIPIDILYEDESITVVNKPPFMPTHPSHGHTNDTLANALAFRYKGENFVFRPINRLDRDTSGLVLIARDKHSSYRLAKSMEKHEIKKTYIALLDGVITPSEGEIDLFIRRKEASIIVREATPNPIEGSQSALTEYKTIRSNNGYSLVEAVPKTGRTHQLRVHFAASGYPIVGDTLYGKADKDIDRQALHANHMEFVHPRTNRLMTFTADYPEDFKNLLIAKGFKV